MPKQRLRRYRAGTIGRAAYDEIKALKGVVEHEPKDTKLKVLMLHRSMALETNIRNDLVKKWLDKEITKMVAKHEARGRKLKDVM